MEVLQCEVEALFIKFPHMNVYFYNRANLINSFFLCIIYFSALACVCATTYVCQ